MNQTQAREPVLLGIDWGTSSLRAWLMNMHGEILDEFRSVAGIMNLPESGFSGALDSVCQALMPTNKVPILACGMVGSANGWIEAPYLDCPVTPSSISGDLVKVKTEWGTLHIIPGLITRGAFPDVMRGEETQILGALTVMSDLARNAVIILPGTHSKWARISEGQLNTFKTFMTGETYAVFSKYSILGKLMDPHSHSQDSSPDVFTEGVKAAAVVPSLSAALFSARSRVLAGQMESAYVGEYLSGLLIGDEIRAGLALPEFEALVNAHDTTCVLVGDESLCQRYVRGLHAFGIAAPTVLGNTASEGLFLIARHRGLIDFNQ